MDNKTIELTGEERLALIDEVDFAEENLADLLKGGDLAATPQERAEMEQRRQLLLAILAKVR